MCLYSIEHKCCSRVCVRAHHVGLLQYFVTPYETVNKWMLFVNCVAVWSQNSVTSHGPQDHHICLSVTFFMGAISKVKCTQLNQNYGWVETENLGENPLSPPRCWNSNGESQLQVSKMHSYGRKTSYGHNFLKNDTKH